MFSRACRRLGAFRWALVTHRFDLLPLPMDLQWREWGEQFRYSRKPESNYDWASWWAPDMFSLEPLEPTGRPIEGVGVLFRFLAGEDEDACFKGAPSERESTHSDVENGGNGMRRLPVIKAKISDFAKDRLHNVVNKRRRVVKCNIELSSAGGTYRSRLARRPLGIEQTHKASLAVGGWP